MIIFVTVEIKYIPGKSLVCNCPGLVFDLWSSQLDKGNHENHMNRLFVHNGTCLCSNRSCT